jgi:hypothetical protein
MSVGWLLPAYAMANVETSTKNTSFRLFIDQKSDFLLPHPIQLDISVLDQFGNRFTGFDASATGRVVTVVAVKNDLSYITKTTFQPDPNGGGAMAGMGMGVEPVEGDEGIMPTYFLFPSEGKYTIFVDFWLKSGEEVQVSAPFTIGAPAASEEKPVPAQKLVQTLDMLQITLKPEQPLVAKQDVLLSFDIVDSAGNDRTNDIAVVSRNQLQMEVVDEGLSMYYRPQLVDRQTMTFKANFPKPGVYKIWLDYMIPGIEQQVGYVIEVK